MGKSTCTETCTVPPDQTNNVPLSVCTSEHEFTYLRRSRLGDLSGASVLRVVFKSFRLGNNKTNHNERLSTYRRKGTTATSWPSFSLL